MIFSRHKLFFTIFSVLITAQFSVLAQTRIRFAKGKTSTVVSGTILKNSNKCFILGARQGQKITATVSSRSSKVQFPWYGGAQAYEGGGTTNYRKQASGGDETICIEIFGKPTNFLLTISIR